LFVSLCESSKITAGKIKRIPKQLTKKQTSSA
jgi:hypothetical protein